ncbi:flagellar motor switch protein FliG [Rosistilla oblonga]|uniref:Flagellar motor switch protein FliG n=1 Tax=Rosistilla oblonga TaxID=2527990 RepID=A0A518IXL6_9BACT|nr:flagellar motor switch protein FliG [Rosistilla oblonga]QDV57828.1 Flagellar motor switch protein FliG [Rosistilla oblonga]
MEKSKFETSLRRCAVLLMSLSTKAATIVMSRLTTAQVEAISLEIARMESVGGTEQEEVMHAFMGTKTSALNVSCGGLNLAKELIRQSMGTDADPVIQRIEQSIEQKPFAFVRRIEPRNLIQFVQDEHPQTIALILSHLPEGYCAEVLSGLDPEKQLEVIQRIAVVGSADTLAMADLERGLEMRLASLVNGTNLHVGGVEHVAGILNVSERSVERTIMEALAEEEPELVDEIRHLMFVFEDIAKMGDKDIQSLLKNVEASKWACALKGCSEPLVNKVMKNMSSRAADNLREEMGFLGAVRLSDVEAAQQGIVDMVRTLEDAGEIARPTGEEEEEFVS